MAKGARGSSRRKANRAGGAPQGETTRAGKAAKTPAAGKAPGAKAAPASKAPPAKAAKGLSEPAPASRSRRKAEPAPEPVESRKARAKAPAAEPGPAEERPGKRRAKGVTPLVEVEPEPVPSELMESHAQAAGRAEIEAMLRGSVEQDDDDDLEVAAEPQNDDDDAALQAGLNALNAEVEALAELVSRERESGLEPLSDDGGGEESGDEAELAAGADDEYFAEELDDFDAAEELAALDGEVDPKPEDTRPAGTRETMRDVSRVEAGPPLAARAVGALVLARDVVGGSLGGGGLGKLWGAARGLAKAVSTGLGASGSREVDEYGKDPDLADALSPVASFLYERYWRVTVEGAELLPDGAAIIVANHSGALPFDGPVLSQAISRERPELREARWLVEDQIFHAPFFGTLFNRLGAVRACPENALRLLSEKRPVIVFPEGAQGTGKSFRERYQLKRLGRGGFAKLAVRAGVPIIPAAVVGAEEALPLLGKLPGRMFGLPDLPLIPGPLPAKWSIRFGEPIPTHSLGPAAAEDLHEIQRVVEQTRAQIEGMLQALLSERRSIFAG
ncbi:MAG TPA: lysophospholipid acyltransferase family protein [Myxococcaceae bacterium]|nr:lysophospholipid acyltransferase family protein [Myxococcaceae bacterium]